MGLLDRLLGRRARSGPHPASATTGERSGDVELLLRLAREGAPLDRQRAALADVLAARGVSPVGVGAALARARDGIVLFEEGKAESTSRLGGQPLLPAGATWPLGPDGRALAFIASIDLAAQPQLEPLPSQGTLLVYWDHSFFELERMDFVAATRVFYVDAGAPIQRQEPRDPGHAFGPLPLTGYLMPVLGELDRVDAPAEDEDALFEATDAVLAVYRHQLLGSSRDVQGPVLEEVPYWFEQAFADTRERYEPAELRGEGWLLLAQFEETEGLTFGDAGALYLVMPEADLRARRFDRVMGIMQSA